MPVVAQVHRSFLNKVEEDIFFLTADAFGILPPISKLNPSQAAYHFISGYTSKVAGTEAGVVNPEPFFSSCFISFCIVLISLV